jgi:predicted CopG family antitoxin
MKTKTISLDLDAYEKLRKAKLLPRESFSDVVRRAVFPEDSITAGELLELSARRRKYFSEETLARVEEANRNDAPPDDPWK